MYHPRRQRFSNKTTYCHNPRITLRILVFNTKIRVLFRYISLTSYLDFSNHRIHCLARSLFDYCANTWMETNKKREWHSLVHQKIYRCPAYVGCNKNLHPSCFIAIIYLVRTVSIGAFLHSFLRKKIHIFEACHDHKTILLLLLLFELRSCGFGGNSHEVDCSN